ncbi:MAG: potassium-transporting ATPase subunit KdpC [Jiangellaceae bacterium]
MIANLFRQSLAGLRVLLVLTVVFGLAYPLVITGVAQVVFRDQANGSRAEVGGTVVGSTLLGQTFDGDEWFQPRPSAAGYDALASGGTNLGPESQELVESIVALKAEIAARDGVAPDEVPADAVTSSGSGLDPHISPDYARIQVDRVARERGLDVDHVRALVEAHVQSRAAGFLGAARVNVLELNIALASLANALPRPPR